ASLTWGFYTLATSQPFRDFHGTGQPLIVGFHEAWENAADAATAAAARAYRDKLRALGATIVRIDDVIDDKQRGIRYLRWINIAHTVGYATALNRLQNWNAPTQADPTKTMLSASGPAIRIAVAMGQINDAQNYRYKNAFLITPDIEAAQRLAGIYSADIQTIF